nr:hypothetical protein [Tanacetum cinerariifolium]
LFTMKRVGNTTSLLFRSILTLNSILRPLHLFHVVTSLKHQWLLWSCDFLIDGDVSSQYSSWQRNPTKQVLGTRNKRYYDAAMINMNGCEVEEKVVESNFVQIGFRRSNVHRPIVKETGNTLKYVRCYNLKRADILGVHPSQRQIRIGHRERSHSVNCIQMEAALESFGL